MASIRLNNRIRDELFSYAKTLIKFPEDDKAYEDAKVLAEKLVRETIAASIPQADLDVLIKYEVIHQRSNFHFHYDGIDRYYDFYNNMPYYGGARDKVNLPYAPYHRVYVGNDALFAALENETFTKEQREKHRSQLEHDYRHLIDSARTFEELEELWPEVSVMRGNYEQRVTKNAVSCLSTEALDRIKADIASRNVD